MKGFWGIASLIGGVLAVALFSYDIGQRTRVKQPAPKPEVMEKVSSYVWRDTETGCEYLKHTDFIPRLGPDGRPLCRSTKP